MDVEDVRLMEKIDLKDDHLTAADESFCLEKDLGEDIPCLLVHLTHRILGPNIGVDIRRDQLPSICA